MNSIQGDKLGLQVTENAAQLSEASTMTATTVSAEDVLRAQIYRLLASFLSQSPTEISLKTASQLTGDTGEFGVAISNFAKIAGRTDHATAETEFHDLFVGVTRGELLPYGSYYQTGFLNEKPLANLRTYMAAQNIERVSDQKEPEDHIASVLEIMAGLIEGNYGGPLSLSEQKNFFNKHVDSWANHFFKDLEEAKKSVLYAPLGTVGRLFMKIEHGAFEMVQ